jgi:dimeric dUTPase (all-alpha-NTP-PPase superfamily)
MLQDNRFKDKFMLMFELQDVLNSKIYPDWRDRNFPFTRAVWAEAAELIDHCGWPWWKQQSVDVPQMQMEVVDIWHFLLSTFHMHYYKIETRDITTFKIFLAMLLTDLTPATTPPERLIPTAEKHVLEVLTYTYNNTTMSGLKAVMQSFIELLSAAGMSFDDLFERYIGKNLLNEFRRDHGYKEGTYIKTWNGREDNEYLHDLLVSNTQITVDNYVEVKDNILTELNLIYTQLNDSKTTI